MVTQAVHELGDAVRAETVQWASPPLFAFPAHLTPYANGRAVATASAWIVSVWQLGGGLVLPIGDRCAHAHRPVRLTTSDSA